MFNFSKFIARVLPRHGESLVAQAKKQMATISYGIQWPNLPNVSSLAGDPPNNQFGHYSKSIRYVMRGGSMLFGAGNSKVGYVQFLETFGNRSNINKAAEVCSDGLSVIVAEEFRGADFMPKMDGFTRS